MIEINLIPDVKQELIKAQHIRATVVSLAITISLIALAVVTILAIYVFAVQTVRSTLADDTIKKGGEQLAKTEDLSKILTIQNQLTKISALNDDKKIDSRIFDVLQSIIPPAPNTIQVSNLTIDAENKVISMDGQAPQSYQALEVFKKTISAAMVKYGDEKDRQEVALASEISISDTSYGEDASGVKVLRFTLKFTYAEELFSPLSTNPVISIANSGNATDSYLGLPKSIFVERAKDLSGAN
jgi:hypothetical protein